MTSISALVIIFINYYSISLMLDAANPLSHINVITIQSDIVDPFNANDTRSAESIKYEFYSYDYTEKGVFPV